MNDFADLRESIRNNNWSEPDIKTVPDKPRRDAVATFRLLTGHDCLGEHLHRIGIDHPQCQLCGSGAPMNREHLHCWQNPDEEVNFFKDTLFPEIRKQYSDAEIDCEKSDLNKINLRLSLVDADDAEKLKNNVSKITNSNWIIYRTQGNFQRKSEWLLLDRQTLITRQNNTNNFCEATIRILKDVVLCRTKAYNIVALTDFCISVWNSYLKQKLMAFAYSRRGEVVLLYNNLNKKTQSLSEENLKEESEHLYTVKSADGKNIYTVNVEHGVCTCEAGASGAFCKHQFFVMKTKGMSLPNAPPISANDRYRLAKLALGAKSPDPIRKILILLVSKTSPVRKKNNEVLKELERLADMMSTNNNENAATAALSILKRIKKPDDFQTLCVLPNLRAKRLKKIGVQSTSISRRRLGLTKSKKRVPSGRPSRILKRGI
nr:uncharacterized protein LOC110282232 [Parasteatoda tepidariorum]